MCQFDVTITGRLTVQVSLPVIVETLHRDESFHGSAARGGGSDGRCGAAVMPLR